MDETLDAEARRATGILKAWLDGLKLEDLRVECRDRGLDTAGIVPTLRNRLRAYFRESGHLPGAVVQAMQANQIRDDAIRRSFKITNDEDENLDETQEENNTTVLNEQDDTNRRESVNDPTRERGDRSADGTPEQIRNPGAGAG